jgi:peroxiredoxin
MSHWDYIDAMLESGDTAPTFSLPGVVDGEIDTVELAAAPDEVVVVAFYPMDFTPACTDELCAIREAELYAVAEHVRLLAISADSAFAHRAFASEHDLNFPLLSDRLGEVAEAYDVLHDELEGHERVPKRSVFVVDTQQTIQYAWSTDDPTKLPDLDEVVHAVQSIQDDGVATEIYTRAHTQYTYGISEFERAQAAYDEENFEVAREMYGEADWYFSEALSGFNRAGRFATPGPIKEAATDAENRTRSFEQAANWFEAAAEQQVVGTAEAAAEYEADAEDALEAARSESELLDPDELPAIEAEAT